MRLSIPNGPSSTIWFGSITGLVPFVISSTARLLENKEPLLLPMADIATETIIYVTEINTSSATKNSPQEIHLKNRVRVWSAEYILEVAKKLSDAIALLKIDQYNKVWQHIDMYIADISTLDPQYALVSLQQLRERLDIFAKQTTQERLQSTTTLYSPPSDEVFSWFRESPYKTKQSECIKALDIRSHATQVLSGYAWAMNTAILKIAGSSPATQLALQKFKVWQDAISSSASMEKIYKEYFGRLDSNIVWVLYQWEILDPRLHPMLAQYFAWRKQTSKISETLKELLYMNLIHRRRTTNTELAE